MAVAEAAPATEPDGVLYQDHELWQPRAVGTLGPATDRVVEQIASYLDVARLNRAHNSDEDIAARAGAFRTAAERAGRQGEVLVDLQGLKFRTGKTTEPVDVGPGDTLRFLYEGYGSHPGFIPVQDDFSPSVGEGQPASMGDGKLTMVIERVGENGVVCCRVISTPGGSYKVVPNKGLNFPESTFPDILHPRDLRDLQALAASDTPPDYIGLSFTQSAAVVRQAREEATRLGLRHVRLVPKIENEAGMRRADEIVAEGDITMVARGDLGPELVDRRRILEAQMTIAGLVKHHRARGRDKGFMVCTSMMPSMVDCSVASIPEYNDAALVALMGGWPALSDELSMNFGHAVEVARTLRGVVDFYAGKSALLQAVATTGIAPDANRGSWW